MIFDVEENESVWRDYEHDVRVKIRPLSKTDMRQFRKKSAIRKGFRGAGEVNEAEMDKLIFRHIIDDWKGIVTPAGKPVPCNEEMIDAVTGKLINFSAWVLEEAITMSETSQTALENELKN